MSGKQYIVSDKEFYDFCTQNRNGDLTVKEFLDSKTPIEIKEESELEDILNKWIATGDMDADKLINAIASPIPIDKNLSDDFLTYFAIEIIKKTRKQEPDKGIMDMHCIENTIDKCKKDFDIKPTDKNSITIAEGVARVELHNYKIFIGDVEVNDLVGNIAEELDNARGSKCKLILEVEK